MTAPAALTVIVLDASPAGALVGARVAAVRIVDNRGATLLHEESRPGHDGIAAMADMLRTCLRAVEPHAPDLIAVCVGPGSFTGLRTSCALASGLGLGVGAPVIGVTRGEALAETLTAAVTAERLDGWIALYGARSGRWFVEQCAANGQIREARAVENSGWAPPEGRWLLAGDAAEDAIGAFDANAQSLAAQTGADCVQIARAAVAQFQNSSPFRAPLPLYVDQPEASKPAGGLRSMPV
ncbi:peptidase [Acetobacter nitrogenifigens DSM 23921 = NBRC 105050]|uniref:Gcp-like domain-containing protein n=1 Tax=Acetobacter nitrogenifigens DSM 23921 = NBRC 105050 TaxID=1120919 RepID=A0A511XBH2_9PROT|nr:tRNA (adenosine(37)-N6)-threonylcarbamoyltransferase complex dimerization subunit type 1 TsaB [Acetobacter nitrogenifigens]GBQ90491.1 peptidase [Acetobacter nitrogenifigens DSM 23921 = NBRC 105050]GEN60333.1 hypothetical protein ANI02nite_22170 [Acetobacter nitrogenifigens DSM 23921 = NBRC 105050]